MKISKYNFKTVLIISLIIFIVIFIILRFGKTFLSYAAFNDFYYSHNLYTFVNEAYKKNEFYKLKYAIFYRDNKYCDKTNFKQLPYLTKNDLIQHNDSMITPPYKKCDLKCVPSCLSDPVLYDSNCSLGQSTGGTSGKSTFIWMNRYNAYIYIYTFLTSFKKNGYRYGDKIMVFYPSNSYFTNEYEKSNGYLSFINVYFLTFSKIDKEKTIEFVNSINSKHPDFIVIFPFVLLQLCINIKTYNLEIKHHPKNINLSGEYLLNCSLHFIKDIFPDSNIENTYGAVEFGEIAHQVKGDKNTFEVFNQFCYLENKDDKIVVTSLINNTFPIIRYVMEDIGTIVNKDGKQYITNLIGKNTNQIIINNIKFTSMDIDNLIQAVNISDNIISIVMEYDASSIDIKYIIFKDYSEEDQSRNRMNTTIFLNKYFKNIKYNIFFIKTYNHNYLKKFKIIVKKDNSDSEPVGGFYKMSTVHI
jgi:phenylacetate-coenzyme A ligase PaaK-like adenylate-forming protein